jgi:hypothetical protein
MPFVSQAYYDNLSGQQQGSILATNTPLGYHPASKDTLYLPEIDRYAGTYVLGVQGVGKSGLLENLILHDIKRGKAVIVVDPHGDLTTNCVAQIPPAWRDSTYVLDMEDETYPFGMNLFALGRAKTQIAAAQAVGRIMYVFEVLWPEVSTQQHLPRYLRAATLVLLDNPGATLLDMYNLLTDDDLRQPLVANVSDPTVRTFWRAQYDELSEAERSRRVQPLINRLESLFMGRSLIRNIVGQPRSTISFRRAIERGETIFIKLPVKTVPQDAELIGTIIIAQLSAAVFSFADIPEAQRPGVSLFVDEFQHFSTPDFASLFTEGRKFGMRVVVAHQYRGQLPDYLRQSTMTARTKVVFKTTPEDGRELAPLFPIKAERVNQADISVDPTKYLLDYGSKNDYVQDFTDSYLRPLQSQRHGGKVNIDGEHFTWDWAEVLNHGAFNSNMMKKFSVEDPTPYLDHLLYEVMIQQSPNLPIPGEVVLGFSNSGRQFFSAARKLHPNSPELAPDFGFPSHLVVTVPGGQVWAKKRIDSANEQLLHFLFLLRHTMRHLASHPVGKIGQPGAADIGCIVANQPRRRAFVRLGEEMATIQTFDTGLRLSGEPLELQATAIRDQTRAKYCHPVTEVQQTFQASAAATDPSSPLAAMIDGVLASRWQEVDEL